MRSNWVEQKTLPDNGVPRIPDRIAGEWIKSAATRAVFDALERTGARARFVGGCVRDALLGRTIGDIDIATDARPDEVIAALEAAGLRAIPTGLAHGTITAVSGGQSFEITTLREDIGTDGRHATVRFTDDWARDASRRDFTINALYADADGTLHDILGSGLADLRAARVRFIGTATARIEEDYLRILRLFRFHAWYGEGDMEPDALVAAAGLSGGLAGLSRERVGNEMMKLLGAPQPALALERMQQTGVMAQVLPFAPDRTAMIHALEALERRFGVSPSPLRRLALIGWGADPTLLVRALRLSNEQGRALKARSAIEYAVSNAASAGRVGFERGTEAGKDLLFLSAAMESRTPELRLIPVIAEGAGMVLPIRAADLMGIGFNAGPELGDALASAQVAWIESDFTLDKATLLDEVRRSKPSS